MAQPAGLQPDQDLPRVRGRDGTVLDGERFGERVDDGGLHDGPALLTVAERPRCAPAAELSPSHLAGPAVRWGRAVHRFEAEGPRTGDDGLPATDPRGPRQLETPGDQGATAE
ncbi:hypothetical protein GCM10010195_07120 [Kitasatospora griseola]|nr:hypothetical protein GCM10010195_07120 [Kitasatospora griseola]